MWVSFTQVKELRDELQVAFEVWENLAVKVNIVYYHAVAATPQQLLVNAFMLEEQKPC